MVPFSGGCACGAIRYLCSAAPMFAAHCYCRDCQRASGGVGATAVIVPRDAVAIDGTAKAYVTKADTGRTVTRWFCEQCGSPLFSQSEANSLVLAIKAGSLDDPSWVEPMAHIWTDSAPPWAELSPDLPRIGKQPA